MKTVWKSAKSLEDNNPGTSVNSLISKINLALDIGFIHKFINSLETLKVKFVKMDHTQMYTTHIKHLKVNIHMNKY